MPPMIPALIQSWPRVLSWAGMIPRPLSGRLGFTIVRTAVFFQRHEQLLVLPCCAKAQSHVCYHHLPFCHHPTVNLETQRCPATPSGEVLVSSSTSNEICSKIYQLRWSYLLPIFAMCQAAQHCPGRIDAIMKPFIRRYCDEASV